MSALSPEAYDPVIETRFYEGKKVAFLFPWYKTSNPRTVFALMALLDRTKMSVLLDFGDAFIAHSRNKLVDNFLKTGVEWACFCDDDMVPPFGNAKLWRSFTGFSDIPDKFAGLNSVDRLLASGKTLIGALYFGRWSSGKPVYCEGAESKQEEEFVRRGPHDLIKPCRWVGTGFTLAHKTVFTDIEKRFPHLARNDRGVAGQWFTSSEHNSVQSVTEVLKLIEEDPNLSTDRVREILLDGRRKSNKFSGLSVGEDVIWCHRAAQSGHQPYVDLGLLCGHIGDFSYGPKKQL